MDETYAGVFLHVDRFGPSSTHDQGRYLYNLLRTIAAKMLHGELVPASRSNVYSTEF